MSKVAIVQSNYIPWKGYFDLINSVDHFVIFDHAQYTKGDWRNRNKIKTPLGAQWLTIPVATSGLCGSQKINEAKTTGKLWARSHWGKICRCYSSTRYFQDFRGLFEKHYLNMTEDFLSKINIQFIHIVNEILNIKTKMHFSSDFVLRGGQNECLVGICSDLGATEYWSGPAAKDYLDERLFARHNIPVHWMTYDGYPEYPQSYPPFEHSVSILDLIFNVGADVSKYMLSFNKNHDQIQ
ncbi:MAG: WbqC family protein [Elusimicrobia bacterium]|nr:WbqC family protein [Elusimicrobiota bacterium]